jgi:hypothetical protein
MLLKLTCLQCVDVSACYGNQSLLHVVEIYMSAPYCVKLMCACTLLLELTCLHVAEIDN